MLGNEVGLQSWKAGAKMAAEWALQGLWCLQGVLKVGLVGSAVSHLEGIESMLLSNFPRNEQA